jgi:Tol biopolymer transport system component
MKKILFSLAIATSLFSCQPSNNMEQAPEQEPEAKALKAWQGNNTGHPTIFAPEVISTGNEFAISFTPDGKEAYFTRTGAGGSLTIYRADFDGTNWSTPRPASFSGNYRDADPFVTYDGQRLFFMSFRPRYEGEQSLEAPDIWYVEREGGGWSDAINLEVVNTDFAEGFPSVSLDGDLYFPSNREGDQNDLYVSTLQNETYTSPTRLSEAVNSSASDSNPGISPDGKLLFFYSNREGIRGAVDLFVSRRENGIWTEAVALGDNINGPNADYCPYVSPDMKYLFFSKGVRTDSSSSNNIYSIALNEALKRLSVPTK